MSPIFMFIRSLSLRTSLALLFILAFTHALAYAQSPVLPQTTSTQTTTAAAAAEATRPRRVHIVTTADGTPRLENDVVLAPLASQQSDPLVKQKPITPFAEPLSLRFRQLLTLGITERLGAPYVYGASGPYYYDCSGFVWSVFQSAGIPFERASARTFWSEFQPVKPGEEFKFGTLVFFNNLQHIGIVADENGFYHASRSNGVTYAPFNKYWTSRIDGFRAIPLPQIAAAE